MPLCSGCAEKIPYQDLDIHQRYCNRDENDETNRSNRGRQLEVRLSVFEHRIEDTVHELEHERERERSRKLDLIGIERSNNRR